MRCGEMMSAIGISNSNQSDLVNVYTLQHARFQTTGADLGYIHACMGFKHHDLLFKYLNSTLH